MESGDDILCSKSPPNIPGRCSNYIALPSVCQVLLTEEPEIDIFILIIHTVLSIHRGRQDRPRYIIQALANPSLHNIHRSTINDL